MPKKEEVKVEAPKVETPVEVKLKAGYENLNVKQVILKETGFLCSNEEKLNRVVEGYLTRGGVLAGGLGELEAKASPVKTLALYDRQGGLITKDGIKVKSGSFWDIKLKAPREKAEILYLYNIGGDVVETEDPSKLSDAINKLEVAKRKKAEKSQEQRSKARRSSIVVGL